MDKTLKAKALREASYLVFFGCIFMLPLTVISHGLSGGEASLVAAPVMFAFAIIWQIATLAYNPRTPVCWSMLLAYLVPLLMLAKSLFPPAN